MKRRFGQNKSRKLPQNQQGNKRSTETSGKGHYRGSLQSLWSTWQPRLWNRQTVNLIILVWILYLLVVINNSTVYEDGVTATSSSGDVASSESAPSPNLRASQSTPRKTPKFLFGIMSLSEDSQEQTRRAAIRKSYLSYYRDFTDTPKRICSLEDILNISDATDPLLQECDIIYAFVMGAKPDGPTELLEASEGQPLVVDHQEVPNAESDAIYLNIQGKTGQSGKSLTWFKYGLSLLEQNPLLDFDYIVKTESDTVLFPKDFWGMVEKEHVRPAPDNTLVYGGTPFDKSKCGGDTAECSKMTAPSYMGSGLYFVSLDLARYMTGATCPRSSLDLPTHEDMAIGNFVGSHPQRESVREISEKDGYRKIWRYPIETPQGIFHWYHAHLKGMGAEGGISNEKITTWEQAVQFQEK